ncbi:MULTISPECIES: MarR family transcriptional regulator [unclassified Amycolatopsis]|uniref:MarR family winged helix-turn-helix transcriptional regulator n=1 Tax=unclassified Amycolatopsis TaxID=2618356 RepID=UPI0028764E71|nr:MULTISPECIES: MarR family transcriptional regulator [unclassified Amycolatopsis]MDS0134857.1 MarR family transcriptional regulator [Amycolatopsis sp. 505]MDS0147967.1 MarR family transcriptional regulator [Amycolatopsis sp. CM201R]
MTDRPADLDYLSFVDYAIGKTQAELPATDPVAMRLGLTLHRLAGALVYDWESTVHRPRGWSWGGFRVLFVLWLAGPLESRHVARLAGMSRAAVSALVKTLERDGLVTRTQVAHDRRAVELALTRAGHTAVTDAYQEHNKREQAWVASLTPEERAVLIGLLEKLTTGPAAAAAQRLT